MGKPLIGNNSVENRPVFNRRFLPLLLLCAVLVLPAMGGGEREGSKPVRVTVSGTVRLVGSGIFPSVVITGENREWQVEKADEKKLVDLQQQTVTVRGMEYYVDLFFANGTPAGRHYYLKNITVIRP